MNITELSLTMIFLFLPGILGVLLIGALTTVKISEFKVFAIYVYLLSLGSYLVSGFFSGYTFLNFLLKGDLNISSNEILFATSISLLLSIACIYTINFKIMYKLAGKMHLSAKYGSNDVWLTLFNDRSTVWVTLRPASCEEYFMGEVEHFSDENNLRELTLLNVAIYEKETSKYLYSQEKMYFSFPYDQEISIEIGSYFIDESRRGENHEQITKKS